MMEKKKKNLLKKHGLKVGTVTEFLDLSKEDEIMIELRLSLGELISSARKRMKISQEKLAKKLGSSQSRVAKMEQADPTVSIDLLIKSLIRMGVDRKEVARAIATE